MLRLAALTPDTVPAWLPRPVKGWLILKAARLRVDQARHLPKAERIAAAFGIDSLDLVHYETLSAYHDDAALMHAVTHEGTPFRSHAQWCHAISEGGGHCDCGAQWQAFIDGELKTMPAPDQP